MERNYKNKQLILFKTRDLRKKDQYKVDDIYLNGYARVCKPVATAVYNSLCRHAEYNTQKAFPSHKLIAYQHSISVKAVSRAIKKLAEYNIILIERERRRGKFTNYLYTLLDKSEWKPINQRTKTTIGKPADIYHQRPATSGKRPTKDNKGVRITKSKDNKKGSNQVATIRDYFIDQCKALKGFEPEMAFGKEGRLLKDKLKRYSVKQLKDLIDRFMRSKIGEDLGYTLSICLSAGVINQWLIGKLERPKKPTYNGNPMRKMYGKWQVLEQGEWKEFADLESKIVFI